MPGTVLGIENTEMNQKLPLSSKSFQVNRRSHRDYENSLFRVHSRLKEECSGFFQGRVRRGCTEESKMSRSSLDRGGKERNSMQCRRNSMHEGPSMCKYNSSM